MGAELLLPCRPPPVRIANRLSTELTSAVWRAAHVAPNGARYAFRRAACLTARRVALNPSLREKAMKLVHRMIAIAAILFTLPAQAASTDPEIVIYRFPGVLDNGGAGNTGIATVFHCTNFSGVPESLRIVVRDADGTIRGNFSQPINHLQTVTLATRPVTIYAEVAFTMGFIQQGTAAVAATSVNLICTAVTVDAASASPVGFSLRGIRFNPAPGSQE